MGRRCCCAAECWEFLDDFGDYGDTTDISAHWNESVGNWEVLSAELHEKVGGAGTANALVFCKEEVPINSAGEMRVQVEIHDAVIGNKFYVSVCCDSDSAIGDGTTVEFEYTSLGWWTTTIQGASAEGTAVQVGSASPLVFVCADRENMMISAGIVGDGDNPYAWDDAFDPGDGRYAALGHNNTTDGAYFDDFEIKELRTGSEECLYCWCQCLAEPIKRTLYIEIVDVELCGGDDLSFFPCEGSGTELEWTWHATNAPTWDGTLVCNGFSWDIVFDCEFTWMLHPETPGWNLAIQSDPVFATEGASVQEDSTCEPLYIKIGPYYLLEFLEEPPVPPDPDPNKACFYLLITEV